MGEKMSKAMREIAADLDGREALRQGSSFWEGGFNIGDAETIEKMSKRGFVRISDASGAFSISCSERTRRASIA